MLKKCRRRQRNSRAILFIKHLNNNSIRHASETAATVSSQQMNFHLNVISASSANSLLGEGRARELRVGLESKLNIGSGSELGKRSASESRARLGMLVRSRPESDQEVEPESKSRKFRSTTEERLIEKVK
ncbi:hypothetical protein EVAR_73134_1 [Eumeta japonica]|uniref:Uncharacterized protein n=1 Tax=Eumeta variegata TaxID=151549 RepID=A0A4C1SZ49_EUMVA|nr:hypothetical protein EVAR_73134_1 [Eumeta japonica]